MSTDSELKQVRAAKENLKEKHLLIKMSYFEYNKIESKARQYTGGNVSEWMRYAASKLEPRTEDIIKQPEGAVGE